MLTPADLAPFATIPEAQAVAMVEDAVAMAGMAAPCLAEAVLSPAQVAAVKAILRRAVLRWFDVGSGAVTQVGSGPFQQSTDTTRSSSRSLFWPSEVSDLQAICREVEGDAGSVKQVFTIQTGATRRGGNHSPICDINFGGGSCSCGSDLNAYRGPLPEFGEAMP